MAMKRLLGLLITTIFCLFAVYAGDVAVFVDLGFSEDGETYFFGQYGRKDKTFEAYAEIYTVDVEDNDFVKNGIFKSSSGSTTKGSALFKELQEKHSSFFDKFNICPSNSEKLLYLRADSEESEIKEIKFKDFESSTDGKSFFYNVRLMPLYEGKGETTKSSFYIVVEKSDEEGNILSKNVIGNPDIKRKGVTGYKIDRIFTNSNGTGFVFLVEKTITDSTGISIRYMVETAEF